MQPAAGHLLRRDVGEVEIMREEMLARDEDLAVLARRHVGAVAHDANRTARHRPARRAAAGARAARPLDRRDRRRLGEPETLVHWDAELLFEVVDQIQLELRTAGD